MFDLINPELAYMFGLIQADGSLSENMRNRGKLTIELKAGDEPILHYLKNLVPYYSSIHPRTRNTNFKDNYKSVVWAVYNLEFRNELLSLGMHYGVKSYDASPPTVEYSKPDFYRGIIDGNGSLGFTAKEFPFVSLVTASQNMSDAYLEYLSNLLDKQKESTRNKRDEVFNIAVYKEDAQLLVKTLYYPGCLAIPRKYESASAISLWKRPSDMRLINFERRHWTDEEDIFVFNHSIEESMEMLNRTDKSIKIRLWRLHNR